MFSRTFFSERIKLLRKSHNLTIIEFSLWLSTISKTTIGAWEKQTNIPSLDSLDEIINWFSISADWLLGYGDIPYNEKIISSIEHKLFSETIENNGVKIPLLRKVSWLPEEYWNEELRSKIYSLPVRANINFLLHIYIAHKKSLLEDQFKREASSPLVNKIMDKKNELQENTTTYQKKKKQFDSYMKQLQDLLAAKESAKPIFDIQAQKTTEE